MASKCSVDSAVRVDPTYPLMFSEFDWKPAGYYRPYHPGVICHSGFQKLLTNQARIGSQISALDAGGATALQESIADSAKSATQSAAVAASAAELTRAAAPLLKALSDVQATLADIDARVRCIEAKVDNKCCLVM